MTKKYKYDYCGYCGETDLKTKLVGGVCKKCNPLWEKDNPKSKKDFGKIRAMYNKKEK